MQIFCQKQYISEVFYRQRDTLKIAFIIEILKYYSPFMLLLTNYNLEEKSHIEFPPRVMNWTQCHELHQHIIKPLKQSNENIQKLFYIVSNSAIKIVKQCNNVFTVSGRAYNFFYIFIIFFS